MPFHILVEFDDLFPLAPLSYLGLSSVFRLLLLSSLSWHSLAPGIHDLCQLTSPCSTSSWDPGFYSYCSSDTSCPLNLSTSALFLGKFLLTPKILVKGQWNICGTRLSRTNSVSIAPITLCQRHILCWSHTPSRMGALSGQGVHLGHLVCPGT